MAKVCQNCGNKNKNVAKFCENCGTSLTNTESTQEGIKDWWDNQSSNSKYGIGLIGFCCLFVIVGLIALGISGMSSSDTASTYSQSIMTTVSNNTQSADTTSQPIVLSGKGQEATKTFHLNGGLTRFEMTHNGNSNFIVHLMDTNGNVQEYVVNEIGAYNGSQAFNVPEGDYLLNVEADGSWTVKITQES